MEATTQRKDWLFAAAALVLALGVFLIFREAPELGDDLDYWGLAFDLHAGVPDAWSAKSFHDFRWPVWGPLWIAQGLGLPGLWAYYAAPLFYFCGTALLVFWIARACDCDRWLALAAVAIYALHPYQDSVFSRPMPDLSEGFWVAGALLCWLRAKGQWSVLAVGGLCLALAASNRITGLFAAFALGVAVLVCEPRRWRELAALAGMTLAFVMIEWTFWAARTGDFLAVLHANLGGRGRAGTGPMPGWELPFRFLKYLWANAWESVLSALLVLGAVAAWRNSRVRTVLVMALVWWLVISCAVQGFDPVRPMLRTSGRFLAGLSPLLAIAGACGLAWVMSKRPALWPRASFAIPLVVVVLALLLTERTTDRDRFPEKIAYVVAATKPGSRVLTDSPMMRVAMLCNAPAARKIRWDLRKQMVVSTPELETAAAQADEVWFFRSKIWNWVLVDQRSGKLRGMSRLASYLEPQGGFWPRRVIAHGQRPEFNFLARDRRELPAAIDHLAQPLDLDRRSFSKGKWMSGETKLRPSWHGTVAAVQIESRSEDEEPLMAWVEFLRDGELVGRLEFEPPGFPEATWNAWYFESPPEANAWRLRVQVRGPVRIESLRTTIAQRGQE